MLGLTASASAPEILVQEVVALRPREARRPEVEEFETVKEDVSFPLPQELKALSEARSAGSGLTGAPAEFPPQARMETGGLPRPARPAGRSTLRLLLAGAGIALLVWLFRTVGWSAIEANLRAIGGCVSSSSSPCTASRRPRSSSVGGP